jgi:hypothetical protein
MKADAPSDHDSDLPHLDFSTFTLGIIGSAYVHLGDAPSIEGEPEQDLELAQHDIEILQLLLEKTKGNLTGDEERLLSGALSDLKSRYLELRKA